MRAIIFTILLFATVQTVLAQATYEISSSEEAVRDVVVELFDGMRAGDSTRVSSVFHPDARLHTTYRMEGFPVVTGGDSIDEFVEAVGRPHDDIWDERIGDITIQLDEGLATAWMDYRFFLGDTFSHCGVNAIQLVQTQAGWKMLNIVDTRRSDC